MELPLSAFVVDVGALTTRVGYAGDDSPWFMLPSYVGVPSSSASSSADTSEFRFPLSFSEKRTDLAVSPCLYPSFSSSALPSYTLHEDVFEHIVRASISRCLPPSSSSSSSSSSSLTADAALGAAGVACREDVETLSDYPVLFSEPNLHCRALREKLACIAFEKLDVPALYIAPRALLSCFAVGRSGGLVVDIGAASLSIAPVVDGFCLHREAGEWPVAGDFLDQVFSCVLARHNLPILPLFATLKPIQTPAGLSLSSLDSQPTSSALRGGSSSASAASWVAARRALYDWTDVDPSFLRLSQAAALRNMRESFCQVFLGDDRGAGAETAEDGGGFPGASGIAEKAQKRCASRPLLLPPADAGRRAQQMPSLQNVKQDAAFTPSRWLAMLPGPAGGRGLHAGTAALLGGAPHILELPDGTRLVGEELANTIPEVLFHPRTILQPLEAESWMDPAAKAFRGLTEELHDVASRVDAEARKEIFNGIVLAGGGAATPGLYERLSRELSREASITMGMKWRLLAAPTLFERRVSTWIGGSVLASMSAFQSLWCSREEYDEHGPSIVERKCY
ncbi:actin like protein ALP2a [Toxoplasma gondii CAST]|uniref:Actin like protein ALP2a n=1 Tax=Toxoplasma gondii CAST TaxID=943122 RepID=A0A425HXW1_TOXGO|nr:actin like protein ALP2a [Toxoplasma gondii CAST]